MAREQVEQLWATVCYTCPARIRTPDGPTCDTRNIGRVKSNGSTPNKPLNCPDGNDQFSTSGIKEILRGNGRNGN